MDLTKGLPKHRVKKMPFSQFVAGDELETDLAQNMKNNRQAKEKEEKDGPSTGTQCRKRWEHKETKVMKGKALRSSGGCSEDLASPSPHKLDDSVLITQPTAYSSPPHFVAHLDKEWLTDIRRARHLWAVIRLMGTTPSRRFYKQL